MSNEISNRVSNGDDGRADLAMVGAGAVDVSDRGAGSAASAAITEVQAAVVMARRFPRNEGDAFGALMRSCGRLSFADGALYSFPRGGQNVEGPSVKMAREAARVWGNIQYGVEVVQDTELSRRIRAFAWDLQSNARVVAEDDFRKLVQRAKYENGRKIGTQWVTPDERDLRELTNRRGAILVRNCILQLLPPDLIDDARGAVRKTLHDGVKTNPDDTRKKIVLGFAALNVSASELEDYLGVGLQHTTPDNLVELRSIYTAIRDGNARWPEFVEARQAERNRQTEPATKPTTKPGAKASEWDKAKDQLRGTTNTTPEATPNENESVLCGMAKDMLATGAITDSEAEELANHSHAEQEAMCIQIAAAKAKRK